MPNPSERKALILSFSTAIILGLLAVVLSGCDAQSEMPHTEVPLPHVEVAEVLVESVTVTDTFNGRLEAPEHVQLRPRVSGYIEEVTFEEGAWVKAGDLLFQIDPRPYQIRVRSAKALLEQAHSELALADSETLRAAQLLESRAISQEEYDRRIATLANARARVSAAEAELETAELNLQYTCITAPVSGRVGRAQVTKGNLANADQTLLTTVVSVHPLYVYFDSNEAASINSHTLFHSFQGTPVRIVLGDADSQAYAGTLNYVGNVVHASTGTLQHRAVLDNPGGLLRPGQFARVEMPVANLEQAVLVRRQAVLTNQDRRYVYVVDEDNRVSHREVTSGRVVGDLVIIESGLHSTDRVVVRGTQKIFASGMRVEPQKVAMREITTAHSAIALNGSR